MDKIPSCIAVIVQHSVSLDIENKCIWFEAYSYYYICRFAVPIFVMCTGILRLEKEVTFNLIGKKYIPRIIFPFVGVVYLIELTNGILDKTIT